MGGHPDSGTLTDDDLSRAFRALGHPHRLTIVRALLERAVACCTNDEPTTAGWIRRAAMWAIWASWWT